MTLTTLFISQVMGVDLTWGEKIKVLAVAMLTSKGAAGVSGAGFITLAATLSSVHPDWAMWSGFFIFACLSSFRGCLWPFLAFSILRLATLSHS